VEVGLDGEKSDGEEESGGEQSDVDGEEGEDIGLGLGLKEEMELGGLGEEEKEAWGEEDILPKEAIGLAPQEDMKEEERIVNGQRKEVRFEE